MARKVDISRKLNYIWNILLWWVSWPPSLCDYQLKCSRELWEKVSAPSHQKPKWVFVLTWSSLCTWTDPPLNWLSSVTVYWLRLSVLFVHFHFVYPYSVSFLSLSMNFHILLVYCIGKAYAVIQHFWFSFFFFFFVCFVTIWTSALCRLFVTELNQTTINKIMSAAIFRKL